jgi:hypothetical protein
MSTVAEVKAVTEQLSAKQRWDLYCWLGESEDVHRLHHDDLRREIAIGIEQANRGDLAPWDLEEAKAEVRRRLNDKGN